MYLRKTLSFSDRSVELSDSGSFAGYASVFGGVDAYGDTIQPGAFADTLKENPAVKMFFNHAWDSVPIGRWVEAKEDDVGLFVRGEFTPGLAVAQDVRAAMAHGTIDGLSIGGFVAKDDTELRPDGGRVIHRWSKLLEISPVTFPADPAAKIDPGSLKSAEMLSAIEEIDTIRDVERLLRDAAGFSRSAATAIVARIKAVISQGDPDNMAKVEDITRRLAAKLNGARS